jgi:GT2 family glycosyltransferase
MGSIVYIILPVHNRREITREFVYCLLSQTYKSYHLILIDDGCSDGTVVMVRSLVPHLTIISGGGDWWWAGSLQQGIDWLSNQNTNDDDVIMFSNDDIKFTPDFLSNAVLILKEMGGLILSQKIYNYEGIPLETGIRANLEKLTFETASVADEINCLSTRGLFMYFHTQKKIGGFFPTLLPHYLSDYEYTIRAGKIGVRLATSPTLTIIENELATGYRNFDGLTFYDFFRKYFSIKSAANPIYWTVFVLMVSPVLFIPLHILRIWLRTSIAVIKNLFFFCKWRR